MSVEPSNQTPASPDKAVRVGIVAACTVGNMVSMTPAVVTVFSLFLVPIAREFRWPRATVSGVLALLAILGAVVYPAAGRVADRFGPRRVILVGQLLFAPAIAALALANGSVLQFYLLFALVGIAGSIPSSSAFSKMICEWFDAGRGTALGIVGGVGNGVGATVMPIIAGLLLVRFGWRWTWVGIALVVFGFGFPLLAALLRDAPKSAAPTSGSAPRPIDNGLTVAQALRTGTFWLILIAIALGAGCVTAVFIHVVPLLTDRGFSVGLATEVLATFALVTSVWQVAIGFLLDRTASPRVVIPMYLAAVAGLTLLSVARTATGLFAGGALLGIGLGAEYGALPYLVSRYFGLRFFGAISGVMYSVVTLTSGFTPFLMDAVFDKTGSYRPAIAAVTGFLLLAAALVLLLPAPPKREALAR